MANERDADLVAERDQLFALYASDRSDENRNAIAESFMPLAEFFAGRYKNRGADSEDLRQVAKLALVKAVARFDPDLGVQFSTFAGRTIDGELKRYFRDKTWAVRVPRSLKERSLQVRRISDQLSLELGRSPTVDQIADQSGLSIEEVLEALDVQSSYSATSIDAGTSSGDDTASLVDRLAYDDVATERTETQLAIRGLLETMPDRERQILELRFFEELSQTEIADRIGVSQMHVSRIIRSSLETLRSKMEHYN